MNRNTKKTSTVNYKLRVSKDKNSIKDLPTKIIIDSNKKIPEKKEDEKQIQSTEIKKEEDQQKKKNRIVTKII